MKTKKLRILSALLALAMLFVLMPTAAFADDSTENNIITYDCGENGNNVTATLNTVTGVMTISGSGKMADYNVIGQPWVGQKDNIKHLVVENGVTSIGNNAFSYCTKLIDADMSKALSLRSISTSFWVCEELNNVELNEGLKEIGGSAFSICTKLKSIHIPSTVEKIGSWCFQQCDILEEVTFANNSQLTAIEGATFYDCTKLKKITIPKSVKAIKKENANGAFSGCSDLKSVIFEPGSQLEEVDLGAFPNRSDLTIYCEESKNNILEGKGGNIKSLNALNPVVTFDIDGNVSCTQSAQENNFKAIKFKDPYKKGYIFAGWYTKNADNEYELFDFDTTITENITLYAKWTPGGDCGAKGNEGNVHWTLDSDGTLTISGSGAMADYSGSSSQPWADQRSSINRVVIGDEVTSIGRNAFVNCPGLKVVELPKNGVLETIKYNAFSWTGSSSEDGAGITEITIPKSVKEIEKFAFDGCTKLATVTFAPVSELETIGSKAFQNTAISEISIPASVKKIGYFSLNDFTEMEGGEVFNDCFKLKKVIFESPSSLENVAWSTFAGCFTRVYGTVYGDDNVMSKLKGIVDDDKIKPLTPTVTFETNGGSKVDSQKVANGTAVTKPTAPTRKGYVFTGWYTKDADGKWAAEPFDFNTLIMDNMTLYARWETKLVPMTPAAELYPIAVDCGTAYDAEGNPIEKAAAGDVVTIKADETAFDGMAFERWEVRKGEVKLENDRAAETTFTMPAGEVQLEAMPRLESPDDSGWDAATVVTGAVIGTGTAILAYHIGMEVYAEQVLGKDVAVPRTRGEVALLAWQLAGSPEPNAAFELLTDEAKAQQWAVESGLMQPDAEGNFRAEKKLSKLKALRVLDAAKKQG